jgi:hypothetical protein
MESTYPFRIGAINWNGVAINAVIITGLTREDEDGFIASEVNHQMLANNLDISAAPAKWVVFVKRPSYMSGEEWRLLGCGSGTEALPAPSANIPDDVFRQLEKILGYERACPDHEE